MQGEAAAATVQQKTPLLDKHRRLLSLVCFAAGLLWFLLFSVVSISTGELKVRSIYLDENSLLVDSSGSQTPSPQTVISQRTLQPLLRWVSGDAAANPCDTLADLGIVCDVWTRDGGAWVVQGLVTSESTPASKETSVVVVPVYGGVQEHTNSVSLVLQLMNQLRDATWTSKNALLLILSDPVAQTHQYRHSQVLEEWLRCYHGLLGADCTQHPLSAGLLREAIVWDMPNTSTIGNVQVLTAGINGQQPNLDLPSTVLHAFNRRAWLDMIAQQETHNLIGSSLFTNLLHQTQAVHLEPAVKRAVLRFLQLCNYMTALVLGPNGLHGQFVRLNIDAVTIRGVASTNNQRPLEFTHLYRRLQQILRVCSNLHEELHHSFNLYLFVDSHSFLAFAEYFTSLPLVMVPLLLLCFQYAPHASGADLVAGCKNLAAGIAFGALPLVAMRPLTVLEDERLREYLRGYFTDTQLSLDWENISADELRALCWFVLQAVTYIACLLSFLHSPLQPHKQRSQRSLEMTSSTNSEQLPARVKLEDQYAPGYKLAFIVFFIVSELWLGLQHYSLAFPTAVLYTLLIWSTHIQGNDDQNSQAPTLRQIVLCIATCPLLVPVWLRIADGSPEGPLRIIGMLLADVSAVHSFALPFVSTMLFAVHCCVVRLVFSRAARGLLSQS